MRCVCVAALLVAGVAPAAAFGQISADGSIRGTVTDAQAAALPGATVTATGTNAGRTFTAVTDDGGVYRLLDVPPGTYTVSAELSGFSRFVRPGVAIRAGANVGIDITLQVGARSEVVEVNAATPLLDVEKPTQSVNISGDFQRSLPLGSRRDWSDFLEVTPGVTSRTINNPQGGQMYILRGGEIDGHVFQVDGADVGSFRQTLPTYLGLSTETLQDVQIKTGGIDASAPLGTGVIVNIATQSGTNTLKGSGALAFTPRSWNGDNTPSGTSAINELFQLDAAAGGPIVAERAWFYGSFKYSRRKTGIFRDETTVNNLRALVPGWEPFANESHLKYSFVKGTTQLSPKHQLLAFWQRDINPEDSAAATDAAQFASTAWGGTAYAARVSSIWSNNLTSRVALSYNDKSFNRDIDVLKDHLGRGPSIAVHERVIPQAGALTGTGAIAQLGNVSSVAQSPTTKVTVQADVTYYRRGWLGSHEIQTGVFLQPHSTWVNENFYVNDGFASEAVVLRDPTNKGAGYIPFLRTIYDTPEAVSTDLEAVDNAIYLQDTWKPHARLTLNVGVRADLVKVTDNIVGAVLQDGWNVGPRLGATYALTADRRNILRGSWARIHEQPYAFSIPTGASETVGVRRLYDVDLNGTFETELYTPPQTVIASNQQIDPDKHMQFTDEWMLGYRRQLPGEAAVDVTLVRRDWKDRPGAIEINGIYDGGVFRGYRDESFNQVYSITNNDWNSLIYTGLEVTVTKRTRDLQLIGGYTRVWDRIDGTWQPNDPASFIQPGAFANDKGIGSFRGGVPDANSYTNTWNTRNSAWQPHQFRAGASYSGPWGLLLGTNYTLMSGPYTGPIIDRVAAPDPAFGPPTVTLSNGRVVQNPLATVDRFAYPTRGEGQIKLPTLHILNVRAGRTFRLGGHRLDASIDVFNATNHDAFQEFFNGASNIRYNPQFILDANGNVRGNNRQFARAAQLVIRYAF